MENITGFSPDELQKDIDPNEEKVLVEIIKRINPNPEISNDCFTATLDIVVSAREIGIPAYPYAAQEVNAARNVDEADTSYHAFSVVGSLGKFIVDTTFKQFADTQTGKIEIGDSEGVFSGIPLSDEVIQQILMQGYIPLTYTSLNTYLDALTGSTAIPRPIRPEDMDSSLAYPVTASDRWHVLRALKKYYKFVPATLRISKK